MTILVWKGPENGALDYISMTLSRRGQQVSATNDERRKLCEG